MNIINRRIAFILAIIITSIWGMTFVMTKVLLVAGLTPMQVMLYRFIIAYLCMIPFAPRKIFANSLKDELIFVLIGLTGGTLYFVSENSALNLTLTSNVTILLGTEPIFMLLISRILLKNEHISRRSVISSCIAFLGVILVVLNGHFVLKLNPLGDFLALFAAASWAFYSVLAKRIEPRYSTSFITRKLFFYGIVTLMPLFLISPITPDLNLFLEPKIIINILLLGVLGSFACFFGWNSVVKQIGAVKASVFIYLVPVVSLIGATLILKEPISTLAIIGMSLIIASVFISNK